MTKAPAEARSAPQRRKAAPRKQTAAKAKSVTSAPSVAAGTPDAGVPTFRSVDIAKEHGLSPKTLRARIRRNIKKWEALFHNGQRHVFPDNPATRKAVKDLLT